MRKVSKLLSVILTVCMLISLLPAQIALATAEGNPDDYIKGRCKGIENVPSDHVGHVWEIQDAEDGVTEYDYALNVYAKDMRASGWGTSLKFDTNDVELVSEYGDVYNQATDNGDISSYVTLGEITADMLYPEGSYDSTARNKLIGKSLTFDTSNSVFLEGQNELSEVSGSSYYQILKTLGVNHNGFKNNDARKNRWINSSTGANCEQDENEFITYTTPSNKCTRLFTLYFKKKGEGISENTFKLAYDVQNEFHGGFGMLMNKETMLPEVHDEGVYLVNFPEKQVAPQTVNFAKVQNSSGEAISGATIKIYSDQAKSDLVATLTTDGDGKASTTLKANSTFYYTIEANNYVTKNDGTINVLENSVEVPSVTLTKTSEVKYPVTITVKNADSASGVVEGATVYVDNSALSGTTNASGQISAELTSGSHTFRAVAPGYKDVGAGAAETLTVGTDGTNNPVAFSIVPTRASIMLPTIKDNAGNVVEGASVVVKKESLNETAEWGDVKTFTGADLASNVELPRDTKFSISVSAPGHTNQTVYMLTDEAGDAKYYSNENCSVDSEITDIATSGITIVALSDPYYKVTVTKGTTTETQNVYTAKVELTNIEAYRGTFGLRYDKDLFTLDDSGFKLESTDEIELHNIVTEENKGIQAVDPITKSGASDTIGYHVFSWRGIYDNTGAQVKPFNTLGVLKPVATYTFKLKSGKSENDIRTDSFTVMPYDKTENGSITINYWKNVFSGTDGAYDNFLIDLWRYTDDKNTGDPDALGFGRLPENKAKMNGFYQVYADGETVTEDGSYMVDVETLIEYENFKAKKASLNFVVTDEDKIPIPNANVTIYGTDDSVVATIKTDATGIASYLVDTDGGDVTYKYTVDCAGYWDYPQVKDEPSGKKSVTLTKADPPVVVNEVVEMEDKVYHPAKLQYADDKSEVPSTEATLSGDQYAYNGRDFRFNIKPAPLKAFDTDAHPTLKVVVDGNEYTATFKKADNVYVLDGANVKGEGTKPADAIGFKADDIAVLIPRDSITVDNTKYTVTALAGTNGTVAYDATAGSNVSGTPTTAADNRTVTIADIEPGKDTGKITFTAAEHFMVEKVVINGVEVNTYNGLTKFDYTFTNVTMDNSIAVTFWDGETPSTDSIITLVVGDKGKVDITGPTEVNGTEVQNTRIVILNPSDSLTFTTTPKDGYELNDVEKEIDSAKTSIKDTASGGTYTVAAVAGKEITIYVTFKDPAAQDTFNVFVTAYVEEGQGSINPVGVLIYNKYDSPTFTLTPSNDDWMIAGVSVDGTKVNLTKADTTYVLASVDHDTSIGAIFAETSYQVHGKIDYSQGKNLTTADVLTPATVKFTRDDGVEVYATNVTLSRTNATFSVEIAPGTWTITVSKKGYLDYIITDFVMGKDTVVLGLDDNTDTTAAKKIVPVIGDTSGKGKAVSFSDGGTVANGMRVGASATLKSKADVDNDDNVTINDMTYTMHNYGTRYTKLTYEEFKGLTE